MTYRLVAWDVDHTLVENAGISKRIYSTAYRALTGTDPEFPPQTEGRTDRAIMRLLFALHGRTLPQWEAVDRALTEVGLEYARELRQVGFALPGAKEALECVDRAAGTIQTVLTGNIRANAYLKLSAFGLDRWLDLDIAAYGSDRTKRADLVPLMQARAESKYGLRFDAGNTIVVGDTPRDVEAGRLGGARVIAVASGLYSVAELRHAGAPTVLAGLAETRLLLEAVSSAGGDVLEPPRRP